MSVVDRPDLDRLDQLHAATGEYAWFYHGVDENGVAIVWHSSGIELVELDTATWDHAAAEAEFIAVSHQVMPRLIAYCRQLEAELAELKNRQEPEGRGRN